MRYQQAEQCLIQQEQHSGADRARSQYTGNNLQQAVQKPSAYLKPPVYFVLIHDSYNRVKVHNWECRLILFYVSGFSTAPKSDFKLNKIDQ